MSCHDNISLITEAAEEPWWFEGNIIHMYSFWHKAILSGLQKIQT